MNGEENELLQLVTTTYGPLLSQKQLAELLKRSHQGLRYSLHCATDPKICTLKACSRRVGPARLLPRARGRPHHHSEGSAMKLGQSSGLKHGRRLAQCALADWRIRRGWLDRLVQGSTRNSTCANAVSPP